MLSVDTIKFYDHLICPKQEAMEHDSYYKEYGLWVILS